MDGTIREAELSALCDLAKHKRVAVKLSAYYALGKKEPPYEDLIPMIRRVLDVFGVDRCMWASDAPYLVQPPHTYAASIGLIRDRLGGYAVRAQWLRSVRPVDNHRGRIMRAHSASCPPPATRG